jgi:AcrR family transcriptional regulator
VRSIAAAAGVSKGSVHYYFADVEDIVDQAMLQATTAWITWLRAGGPSELPEDPEPAELLWCSVTACLEPFAHGDRSLLPLWMEYWALRSRADQLEPLRLLQALLTGYVAELLDRAGIADSEARSMAVTSYLFGTSMEQSVCPVDQARVRLDIAALCGIDPPA